MKYCLSVIFLVISFSSFAAVYHFSSTGNDQTGNGSISAPWQSIDKLNKMIANSKEGDSFLLKKGDTFFGSVIIQQSGSKAQPLVIGAYGTGNKPVITGLSTISGWKPAGKGLYERVPVATLEGSLNMVLVNGDFQAIGRFPKAGRGNDSYFYINDHTGSTGINSNDIKSLPNFTGGELVQRKMQWIFDRSVITNQNATEISSRPLVSPDHPSVTYENMNGHGFFFQNHINTLSAFGDWCFNKKENKFTMYFGDKKPGAYVVQIATIGSLMRIENANTYTINDVWFKGANEDLVSLNGVSYTNFVNCTFQFAGIDAIDVNRTNVAATHHNNVINCSFNNTNNNALNLVESTWWHISGNHINNTGMVQGMGLSGDGQYVGMYKVGANSIVEYNEVENAGYHAIWFMGDNTIVRYNHVHHFLLVKSDGGGIYTYGSTGRNRVVQNNIVHNGKGDRYGMGEKENPYTSQVHGIYIDSHSGGVTISNNTSFNNGHSGLWLGSNHDITVTGNTLFNNKFAQLKGADNERTYSNITVTDNLLVAKEKGSLILSMNISAASMQQLNINRNYYSRPSLEPGGIRGAKGYSIVPFSWDTYHDGGTIETLNTFYSLENWQKLNGKDAATSKTNNRVNAKSTLQIEYNPTKFSVTKKLQGNATDIKGEKINGLVTLQPYTSIIVVTQNNSPLAPGSLQLKKD